MKKSKVVSIRVSEGKEAMIQKLCEEKSKSKNELLSEMIDRNLESKSKKSNLEKLLILLKEIVDVEKINGLETPRIILGTLEDDGEEYAGKQQILVGDDTLIREKDGMFYSYDFHNEDLEPEWMNFIEILDYYDGINSAYGVPSIESGDSYHYCLGYYNTMKSLISILELELNINNTEDNN